MTVKKKGVERVMCDVTDILRSWIHLPFDERRKTETSAEYRWSCYVGEALVKKKKKKKRETSLT